MYVCVCCVCMYVCVCVCVSVYVCMYFLAAFYGFGTEYEYTGAVDFYISYVIFDFVVSVANMNKFCSSIS
jgi:hypothetical protein